MIAELGAVDHVVHCAADCDITAGTDAQRATNVDGTPRGDRADPTAGSDAASRVLGRGRRHLRRRVHRGSFRRRPRSAHPLPADQVRGRIVGAQHAGTAVPDLPTHRGGGGSRTGEKDRADGLYYLFPLLARLAVLPGFTPMMVPDTAHANIVPVDYVVDALVALIPAEGRDGQTFHLAAPQLIGLPDVYRSLSGAAGLPPLLGRAASLGGRPGAPRPGPRQGVAQHGRHQLGRPANSSTSSLPAPGSPPITPGKHCAAPVLPLRSSPATRRYCGGTGRRTWIPTGLAATEIRPDRWWDVARHHRRGLQRDRAGAAIAVAERGACVLCWPAMVRPSMIWSPRFAPRVVRRTHSVATSPIRRRWNTPSKTSWAASTTSTTW